MMAGLSQPLSVSDPANGASSALSSELFPICFVVSRGSMPACGAQWTMPTPWLGPIISFEVSRAAVDKQLRPIYCGRAVHACGLSPLKNDMMNPH